MSVVAVNNLVKTYGDLTAVDGISFTIEEGEIFALLGPNGAGKTTTVEILEGYRQADGGGIEVLGHNPWGAASDLFQTIGIVHQSSGIEDELTVKEFLTHFGRYYRQRRLAAELAELVGLEAELDRRIKVLSGGQRRRLDLAFALVGRPKLLFLDEPTTGFDPAARRQAWSVISSLRQQGTTILLTSHYLEEVQRLADRLAVITRGRIVAAGDPITLGGRQQRAAEIRFRLADGGLLNPPIEPSTRTLDRLTYVTDAPTALIHRLTGWALEAGIELEGLEVVRPTLEDVYLELAGE